MFNDRSLVLLSLAALVAGSCAFSTNYIDFEPRIVNGKPAARGQFPYYALVEIVLDDGRKRICGGTLINDQWILTAGHCVDIDDLTISHFNVHLGALNVTNFEEEGRILVTTNQSFPHPEYFSNVNENDVALLKLNVPVEFSETIQPINLTQQALEPGSYVTAIGFGKLRTSDKTISPTLQFVELEVISREQCALTFPFLFTREDVICTTGEKHKSICNGDSGGPLVYVENGVPSLVGSTSFGHIKGCELGYPSGFSNTYQFLSWINETIASQSDL